MAALLPYAEVLFGALLLAACYFLFRPLKTFAAARVSRPGGKVFNADEFLVLGWIVVASIGVAFVIYGLTS